MTTAPSRGSQPLRRGYVDRRPAWVLRMRKTAVLLCLGPEDVLLLPFWGASGGTAEAADYLLHPQGNRPSQREFVDGQPTAYPVNGDPLYKEVCLVVGRPDGSREIRLCYVEDRITEIDGYPALELVFEDELIGLQVIQRFHVFAELDLVSRSVVVENRGNEVLVLERVLSGALPLPRLTNSPCPRCAVSSRAPPFS